MANLAPEHMSALRSYLREFTASPVNGADQEKADVMNTLIPQIIDSLSDEELTYMMNDTWSYILTSMINAPSEQQRREVEEHEQAPSPTVELTDS
jgi:hypothetical protein